MSSTNFFSRGARRAGAFVLTTLFSTGLFAADLSAQGVVTGTVYDEAQGVGTPIAGALVAFSGGEFVITDAQGQFTSTRPWNPRTYLQVTAPGYAPRYAAYRIDHGQTTTVDVGLTTANVPTMTVTTYPAPGSSIELSIFGDVGSPVLVFFGNRPFIPAYDFEFIGLGHFWCGGNVRSLSIGSVGGDGARTIHFTAPSTIGARLHLQGVVAVAGQYRLTNGVAFEVR